MSVPAIPLTRHAEPLAAPRPVRGSAPHLQPVSAPARSRSVVPFVVLCVTVILAALVSVLVLNISMAARAYEIKDLESTVSSLADQRAELLTTLDAMAAPQRLADTARALGMVEASEVGFISLSDGTITPPGKARP